MPTRNLPKSVSAYMGALARKANASMRGTATARARARKAAAARWKKRKKRIKP
jgi:hypothetical protein